MTSVKIFVYLCCADRYAEARSGFERRGADIMGSVYLTLFLDYLEPGKFHISVKNVATVDDLCGYVYFTIVSTRVLQMVIITYLREASA